MFGNLLFSFVFSLSKILFGNNLKWLERLFISLWNFVTFVGWAALSMWTPIKMFFWIFSTYYQRILWLLFLVASVACMNPDEWINKNNFTKCIHLTNKILGSVWKKLMQSRQPVTDLGIVLACVQCTTLWLFMTILQEVTDKDFVYIMQYQCFAYMLKLSFLIEQS